MSTKDQLFFEDVPFAHDHPDDEGEHKTIANVIGKDANKKSAGAADHRAECIMEGMCHDGSKVPSRDGKELDQRVAAHA